jgi:hypothetical protein
VRDQTVVAEFHESGAAEEVDNGIEMPVEQRQQFTVSDISGRHGQQRVWLASE